MKFTDGYWLKRAGWSVLHPREAQSVQASPTSLRVVAPTRSLAFRGAELDAAAATLTLTPVADGVIKVRIEHFRGARDDGPHFRLHLDDTYRGVVTVHGLAGQVEAGELVAELRGAGQFEVVFRSGERVITSSILKSIGIATAPDGASYMHEQLVMQPNEAIYGLGERFGPVVKNGQSIDLWNCDGGTASEQAYKNVPFYLSSRGYGVLINHAEKVSLEVGSEVNTRIQFSVPGQYLEYFLIDGPTPKDVLRRYTALTGRAPAVPPWSYGLWLSTSFTTDYSEETVNSFIDKMEELNLPLSVLHFDCYWMRPNHWCDFVWDPDKFADPGAMLSRYHERGIKVCVWINPYIAQQSHLWDEGQKKGYLVKRPDGSVRQWDHWQSGMAWVDFTNPAATAWWKDQLRVLLRQGVDAFKTDFGERVPTDVVWHDGSDPDRMHNYYSLLYNQAAYEVIVEERGVTEAILFARAATAGSQSLPVHWGGDSEPTFVSMAETLRGGLSLSMSGFAYWSHDIGGFEGKPNNAVFTRWLPFGMLSSHSRLHGSNTYRVPWQYGEDAVAAARRFIGLKNRLMPYLLAAGAEAQSDGIPLMRHMLLEFPDDLGSRHVDTQYLLGPSLLIAPVFTDSGEVNLYLPSPGWMSLLDGHRISQAGWHRERHLMDSLPVMVRPNTVLPVGSRSDATVYDYDTDVTLVVVEPHEGLDTTLTLPGGSSFRVSFRGGLLEAIRLRGEGGWNLFLLGDGADRVAEGIAPGRLTSGSGTRLTIS